MKAVPYYSIRAGLKCIRAVTGFKKISTLLPLLLVLLLILPMRGLSSAADTEKAVGLSKEETNLRLGPFDVHPYAVVSETHSDNIFYTPDNKESDFITAFTPGILLQLPFRTHMLSFDCNTTLTRYSKNSSEDTTDYSLTGKGNFMFGSLVNLKVSDAYARGHEPRSSSSTGLIERYRTNDASASVTYLLAEVSKVQVDYVRTNWDFETSQFRSRTEDLVSAYVYYRMLPKTSAFVEYDFKNVDFNDESIGLDNTVHTGQLGLTWELTEKSKGTVKGGVLVKNFNLSSQGNLSTWVASVDVNHDFSDYTSLRLTGMRVVNESSLLGTRYYITTGLYGELTYRFIDRLAGVVRGSYAEDKYSDTVPGDTVVRKDKTLLAGAGLRYFFRRWMRLDLDYNYRKRDSNIDAFDYTENSFVLTLTTAL